MDSDFLYVSVEEAARELERRQQDSDFRIHVDRFFSGGPDSLMDVMPRAVLSRYIATPNIEFERFLSTARRHNLQPTVLEFAKDKFIARNPEKYALARMSFIDTEKSFSKKIMVKSVVNFNTQEGNSLECVRTHDGESLVDFHHGLLAGYMDSRGLLEVHDFSDWFLPNRGADRWSYYLQYFWQFLYRGILFENFLLNSREYAFTTEVVFPAFRTIQDITGSRPLIVRSIPKESENEEYWCYYDKRHIATL